MYHQVTSRSKKFMNEIIVDNITPKQEKAYSNYSQLINTGGQEIALYLFRGKLLKEIRDEKLYNYLGEGGYDTFQMFLQDPELKWKPSTSYAYIRIYEYYVLRLNLSDTELRRIAWNRLQMVLPKLKAKEDGEAKEIITSIGEMTHSDYKKEIEEKKLTIDKPSLYRDDETSKWIFEFREHQMSRIYNLDKKVVIFPLEVTTKK